MKTLSKIQVGKVLLIVLSLVLTMMPTMVYAQENSVPAYISIAATSIDVVISERMTMSAAAETENLTISPIEVTNNAALGPVSITAISVDTLDGWQLVPSDTNFAHMSANAKRIYLGYSEHDFSAGSLKANLVVLPGETSTIQLEGKTGIVTSDVNNQQVANIILTIGINQSEPDDEGPAAGLYNEDGDLELSWDDLVSQYGYDVEEDYDRGAALDGDNPGSWMFDSDLGTNLTLIIPDYVTSVGSHNLYTATCLSSVVIPSSVTDIGEGAFWQSTISTFYFKNSTVAEALIADTHYSSDNATKSEDYNW